MVEYEVKSMGQKVKVNSWPGQSVVWDNGKYPVTPVATSIPMQ